VFPAAVDSRRSPALVRGCGADPAPPVPAHVGRISADLLQDQAADLPDALFSVAGPASMVDDVRTMPRSTGVARRRIRHVAPGHRWRNAP
jgi:ferredoxin-NADP reductase